MNKNIESTMEATKDLNLYEVYLYNDCQINEGTYEGAQPGTVDGWEIKWVLASSKDALKDFPYFDCVISTNDNSTGHRLSAIIWR